MKVILPILLIFMLLPSSAKGSESRWLGEYVDDEIPGYEILQLTYLLGTPQSGVTFEFALNSMLLELINDCRKKNGKALVNVKLVISLGVLNSSKKSGETGIYGTMLANCVTRVRKK